MSDDDPQARQQRMAARRQQAEAQAGAEARAREELSAEQARGFRRACAPHGWALDGTTLYLVGLGSLFATAGLYAALATLVPGMGLVRLANLFGGERFGAGVMALSAFGVAFVVPALLKALATPGAERAAQAERGWLSAQPFHLPDAERAYGSASRKLRASVYFGERPDGRLEQRARALLEEASMEAQVSTHSDELRIELALGLDREASDWAHGRAYRLLVHDLVGLVLTPLHAEAPIQKVALR